MTKKSRRSGKGKKGYDVGYGKPPVANRFKPGRSGNPRGRPKALPNISEMTAKELKTRRQITIDGKLVSLPRLAIAIKVLVSAAMKGDFKALRTALDIAGPQLRKELRGEIEMIKPTMSPQEAMDLFTKTMVHDIDDEVYAFLDKKKGTY